MKKHNIIYMLVILLLVIGCQQPDELLPPVSRNGINSITATFEDGTGEFIGYFEEGSNEIIVPIPYYFPISSNQEVTVEQMKRMRVSANLDDNVTISPSLLYLDLTRENNITVTDQRKEKKDYVVRAEVRKSSEAHIEEFSLPELGLAGVINESTQTISLVAIGELAPAKAELRLSYHASISPDPREELIDYNGEVQFTVTAHDGLTKQVYTVKKEVPEKLPFGIRSGSAKLMFAKQLNVDLGIGVDHLSGGLALSGDHIVINTRGTNSVYLNAKTGEKEGEIDLGGIKGSLTNFYSTSDDAGNILVCNLAPNSGAFKVYTISSVEDNPELFLTWDGGVPIGRKLSVQGSLDGDAIITAPILQAGQQIARWQVEGGTLVSQEPEIITMAGLEKGWGTNSDVVYSSGSDLNSDYFVASYSDNTFAWVDGTSNTVSSKLDAISANFIPNAVDYIAFNNSSFATLNWVNSFTWGAADAVWLLDVSNESDFSGNLSNKTCPAVVWEAPLNTYGPNAIGAPANLNGTGDVILKVSEDGYYLYLYFMFTNGYVVGYQFDCIDL
ncbi:DUF5018 domain-containing protein [Echinicola shivajiensis]|uniref:DUF5018 domain-containing protein n=1 Tax=Echinicola shivajiensis TaxID=1035916 RepID=UPI001BFC8682|nr:DUF5018 domain-containing protein [Echinicola shivajiensis]